MIQTKDALEQLFKFDRQLLGTGYDNALEYINTLLGLDIVEIPSGTEFGTWTVPDEWIIRDAWVKKDGVKILDYQTDPLSVVVYSEPVHKTVDLQELKAHLHYSDDKPEATPYVFKFYERDWGFCTPKSLLKEKIIYDEAGDLICENGVCVPKLKDTDESVGKVLIEGMEYVPEFKDKLEEGEYEVFIDSEFKPGIMKLGVHTIPGKTDREVLLFAHLDHPYQANDNLSAVVCLMELEHRLKDLEHTVKIVFCPETIGSIAYAYTQDLSKVDFMIAVDICGNDHSILLHKAFDNESKLNRVAHCALQILGKPYRKTRFCSVIGSDETVFNDPEINIPGILLTRHPYAEYHTSEDTPDKIHYDKITETGDLVLKIIEVWEKDFIPERKFKGPLMRSRYGLQSPSPQVNLNLDYLFYSLDGKKSVAELCSDFELNFEQVYEMLTKIEDDKKISRVTAGKKAVKKTAK